MPIDTGAALFELLKKIVFTAISKRVNYKIEKFLTKRKIESRLEDSIAHVVEGLLPFFESEHISEKKRDVLLNTCDMELSKLLSEPKEFFVASLDGQKIFDRRYVSGVLPQAIRDEGLEDLYALIFPQIANLICAYPPVVEQWKIEGYKDGFRRLDEIAETLGNVANKLDVFVSKDEHIADILLKRVRQSLTQRVEFHLDLTGLRGDRPDAVPLEKCFVVPEFSSTKKDVKSKQEREIRIGTESEILRAFTGASKRCIVIGAPGSGKSIWSLWLQRLQLTGEGSRLAVLIRFRDLVKRDELPSCQEIVREAAGTHFREDVDPTAVREWCKSGSITFILDGFDEIPPNKRDIMSTWIEDLGVAIENAGLILTSRPLTTSHLRKLPKPWVQWELRPFDEQRIKDYISRWYAHAPLLTEKQRSVDAGELANSWVNDSALHPLVGTPLMLATILMVHHMDGELPRGRAKLYERYIDGMLGLWDSRWGIPAAIELRLDLKRSILTRLALHLHLAEIEQFGDTEIEQFMASILPDVGCKHPVSDVLDHLRERTGLLIGPGTWSFVHKNVAEFLVAAAIRDGDQLDSSGQKLDRLRLFKERHNDRWNAVLFFWAGLAAPGDLRSFIEQVVAQLKDKDFLLALSLMYDQLQPHRLTESWKSEQLLKLLRRGFEKKKSEMNDFYFCAPVPKGMNTQVKVQYLFLRILENVDFRYCFWECLRTSNITIEQAIKCHESLRFYVWSSFVTRPRTVKELQFALSARTWSNPVPAVWMMFPCTWGLAEAAKGTNVVSLDQFIDTLCQSVPEYIEKIVFFLLGVFIYQFEFDQPRLRFFDAQSTQNLFQAIESRRQLKVDREWLILSKEFIEFPFTHPGLAFDLLDMFLKRLAEAIKLGWISDDILVANVRDFVLQLRERRDTLPPKQSPPSKRKIT
ncbi:NACHT domain-containing protein [bacterium]|nr:NACHT domain-containing protein [bacterium]